MWFIWPVIKFILSLRLVIKSLSIRKAQKFSSTEDITWC